MMQQPDELSLSADEGQESPVEPQENEASAIGDADSADVPPEDTDAAVPVEAELAECQLRVLRLQAELENYRKRAQRTLDEERRYASLPLMRDLLPVLDNLQRAIEHAQQNQGGAGLLEGVMMVAEQFTTVLKQHHCEEIPAEGARFDPNLHEAIAQLPSEGHEPGDITQVTQAGYQLHERVIRPSQVIVAGAKPDA